MTRSRKVSWFCMLAFVLLMVGCSGEDGGNVTDSHTHKYEKTVISEASCLAEGECLFQCECGDSYSEGISKTEHNYDEWVVFSAPTESAAGQLLRKCKTDGRHEETKSLPELNAEDYQYTVLEEPKTEETGLGEYVFVIDGQTFSFQVEIPATHRYGEGIVTKKSTCGENGEILYTCGECGNKKVEVVPKLDHDYGDWYVKYKPTVICAGELEAVCRADATHIGKMELPILSEENGYTFESIVSATDLTDGLVRYTYVVGDQVFVFEVVIYSNETEFDPR